MFYRIEVTAGNAGSWWWHIYRMGQKIMSGFEGSREEAVERAKAILRAQGIHVTRAG